MRRPAWVTARLRQPASWLAGIAVLAVFLAIASVAIALWPSEQTNKAEARARLALARQLAAQSLNQLDANNDLVWLLAIEAGRRAETVETSTALRQAFAHRGRTLAILSGHSDQVNYAAWSHDDKRVLTASNDGTVRVWDAATERSSKSQAGSWISPCFR